ncbi:hypothetical protein L4C31_00485 [Aliivibrio sifiae]
MSFIIEELKEGIKELVKVHGRTSKMTIIRQLFIPLTDAMKEGVKLELINNYLNEQGLELTLATLRNMIYRIRKERGITLQKRSAPELNSQPLPPINNSSPVASKTEPDYQARYDDLMLRYKATKDYKEKYTILGGNPQKLDGHTPRKQREMCIELQMKIHNQYKPFIKL